MNVSEVLEMVVAKIASLSAADVSPNPTQETTSLQSSIHLLHLMSTEAEISSVRQLVRAPAQTSWKIVVHFFT